MSLKTNVNNKIVTVDARGLVCPMPVVKAKKALESLIAGQVVITVDNQIARDNVEKFAKNLNLPVNIVSEEGNFILSIIKEGGIALAAPEAQTQVATLPERSGDNTAVLVLSDKIGGPSAELGEALSKSFFYALTECSSIPRTIILMNGAVNFACSGSDVLASLRTLAHQGVEIMACGTCLDYLQLEEDLEVGQVSNMFSIIEKLLAADKVITIS